jgi:hypothetical protein
MAAIIINFFADCVGSGLYTIFFSALPHIVRENLGALPSVINNSKSPRRRVTLENTLMPPSVVSEKGVHPQIFQTYHLVSILAHPHDGLFQKAPKFRSNRGSR